MELIFVVKTKKGAELLTRTPLVFNFDYYLIKKKLLQSLIEHPI